MVAWRFFRLPDKGGGAKLRAFDAFDAFRQLADRPCLNLPGRQKCRGKLFYSLRHFFLKVIYWALAAVLKLIQSVRDRLFMFLSLSRASIRMR